MRARRLLAMLVVFLMIAAACGGDDDTADDPAGDDDVATDETTAEATPTPTPVVEAGGGEAGGAGAAGGDDGDTGDGAADDDDDDGAGGDDEGAVDPRPEPDALDCTDGGPITGGAFPSPAEGDRLLVDARMGTQPGFDRFVLEFSGDVGVPPSAWFAQWSTVPIAAEGSGEPIDVLGDWYLELRVAGATMFDFDTGVAYDGPTEVTAATTNVREAASGGSFEGYMVWAIGALEPTAFRVQELTEPSRLVVDICTDGPTFEDRAASGPAPCSNADVPPGVTQFAESVGGEDLDGDGAPDTIGAFLDPAINRWVLTVEPGGGGYVTLPTEVGSPVAPGSIIGSIDIDGDGIREIFGVFDVGARATVINVAQYFGCELRWLRFPEGDAAGFVVTGGIFDAASVSCVFPEGWIVQNSAVNLATDPDTGEPITWTIEATIYRIEGDTLIDVNAGAPPNPDPPFFETNVPPLDATLECGSLSL